MQQETVKVLYESDHIRIEEIVSHGLASSPDFFYDQDEAEFVMVTKGNATLEINSKLVKLETNDHLLIPPHCKHRIVSTSADCCWYCLFFKQ